MRTRMNFIPTPLACLAFLAAAVLPCRAGADASISPYWAEAGKPVTLTVTGFAGMCAPLFAHHAVTVEKGIIRLEVMAENNPAALCINDTLNYSHTDFQLPPLAADTYAVSLQVKPACAYTPPFCPFALIIQSAGTLTVTDSAKLGFTILPRHVDAGKAFDFRLVNKAWNCTTRFSNLNYYLNGHFLYVNYLVGPSTVDTTCLVPASPQGPVFHVSPLPAGSYQIMAAAQVYCNAIGPCPLAMIAPQLAGALLVGEMPTAVRAGGNAGAGRKPSPEMGSAQARFRRGSLRADGRLRRNPDLLPSVVPMP